MSELSSPYRSKTSKILEANKHLDFVRRAMQGHDQTLKIDNGDGTHSTHLMASSEMDGRGYAYPTVVNTVGGLRQLGGREAFEHARRNKHWIEFPTDLEARAFAEGGYKEDWR